MKNVINKLTPSLYRAAAVAAEVAVEVVGRCPFITCRRGRRCLTGNAKRVVSWMISCVPSNHFD